MGGSMYPEVREQLYKRVTWIVCSLLPPLYMWVLRFRLRLSGLHSKFFFLLNHPLDLVILFLIVSLVFSS